MDELGIDVQVLYTSIFLDPVTDRPDTEVALCGAYNRWMADVWKRSNGRLRWLANLPLLSMPDALDQLKFAKENGGCGIFMRPLEGARLELALVLLRGAALVAGDVVDRLTQALKASNDPISTFFADRETKQRAVLHNKLDSLLRNTQKSFAKFGGMLSANDQEIAERVFSEAEEASKSEDREPVNKALTALE